MKWSEDSYLLSVITKLSVPFILALFLQVQLLKKLPSHSFDEI